MPRRAQVGALADAVQEATGNTVDLAWGDQGDTGEAPADEAAERGINLVMVSLPAAKRGFVLLPRRWVVERSFAWATRFRRVANDDERLPETVAGRHFLAFACLMLHKWVLLPQGSPGHALVVGRRQDRAKDATRRCARRRHRSILVHHERISE